MRGIEKTVQWFSLRSYTNRITVLHSALKLFWNDCFCRLDHDSFRFFHDLQTHSSAGFINNVCIMAKQSLKKYLLT